MAPCRSDHRRAGQPPRAGSCPGSARSAPSSLACRSGRWRRSCRHGATSRISSARRHPAHSPRSAPSWAKYGPSHRHGSPPSWPGGGPATPPPHRCCGITPNWPATPPRPGICSPACCAAWEVLIEPWWRLRDVLDADITVRARQLAQAGLAATLNDLDPRISYHQGILRCAMTAEEELHAAGTQLVLIPSVFAWPGVGVNYDPPAVIYPARGTATLWQPPAPGCCAPSPSRRLPPAWPPAVGCLPAPPASTSPCCAPTA